MIFAIHYVPLLMEICSFDNSVTGKPVNRAMIGSAYANGGVFFAVPSMVARPTLMTPFSLR
jgi:hypothetical protein